MDELMTSLGINVVTIIGLVAYIVRMEMKQKELVARREEDNKSHEKELKAATDNVTERLLHFGNSKKAMKAEFEEKIKDLKTENEKKEQILHQRIDRVRDDGTNKYEKLELKIKELETKYDSNTQTILDAIKNIK